MDKLKKHLTFIFINKYDEIMLVIEKEVNLHKDPGEVKELVIEEFKKDNPYYKKTYLDRFNVKCIKDYVPMLLTASSVHIIKFSQTEIKD